MKREIPRGHTAEWRVQDSQVQGGRRDILSHVICLTFLPCARVVFAEA